MIKIIFDQDNKTNFGSLQAQVSTELVNCLAKEKDFYVELGEVRKGKTYQQLKAIHKLCSLYALRLTETQGRKFTIDMAKESIKYKFGYVRLCTEEEAFAEAMKIRHENLRFGKKMTLPQFNFLVSKLQRTYEVPKSFADASKQEMIELIEKIEQFGQDMDWQELKLETKEMEELIKYYS